MVRLGGLLLVGAGALLIQVRGGSDENPGRLLSRAAQGLMEIPIPAENQNGDQLLAYEVKQPHHDDLAVSRLQTKMTQTADDLWTIIKDPRLLDRLRASGGSAAEEVLKLFAERLQSDIFALDQQIRRSQVLTTLKTAPIVSSEVGSRWSSAWKDLQKTVVQVEVMFNIFDGYMTEKASDVALEDFARTIVEPGSAHEISLLSSLVRLHNLTIPSLGLGSINDYDADRKDIFYLMSKALNNQGDMDMSVLGQSPNQLLYNLYNYVALAEIKGYAMIQFSYMILRLYNRGEFSIESDLARQNFETQAKEKLLVVKGILPTMSREFWRSDPDRHVEGETYVRMTELLQGIIENEIDFNSRKSCKDSCNAYDVAETQNRCYKNLFCAKQPKRCNDGRLFECTFFDADAWVCMSNDPFRRYEWVEYEDNTLLGSKGQCINKIKVDSWWKWLFWHCSYCVCKCDQPGPRSDRFWSLKAATSDIDANKVVTGVRFVKKDRIIQLEIEQAVALPEGGINEETREWKLVEPMSLDQAKENEDYIQMSYEQRSLDTDILDAPKGHVVTGVKLRNIGGHLNLEIQVTPIVFTDGNLIATRSTWMGNDNTPATASPRKQVDILMPDIPTKFRGQSRIDSRNNEYISFDTTSAHKDVMQTTIPYIDAQDVRPKSGVWLTGVGLYHKGHIGYGGYVGIMIKTFDFGRHLLPERTSRKENEELKFDFDAIKQAQTVIKKK